MIYWFTGNTGAGKTTLAKIFQKVIANSILLDGDYLRGVWQDLGFSKEDRVEQNNRVMKLAEILEAQGFNVLVAVICPHTKTKGTHLKYVESNSYV